MSRDPSNRRPAHGAFVALAVIVLSALLAGCGGGGGGGGGANAAPATTRTSPTTATAATTAPAAAVGAIDPCSLLTDAEVAKLAPGVGHGKLDTVGGAKICDWPDAHGIPAVQLQVYAPQAPSLREELKTGIGAYGGYTIVAVPGLGDEAAAAFQQANASKGLEAGLAALTARSGNRVVGLTTPRVQVKQGSSSFELAKQLVAKAIGRLPASG